MTEKWKVTPQLQQEIPQMHIGLSSASHLVSTA